MEAESESALETQHVGLHFRAWETCRHAPCLAATLPQSFGSRTRNRFWQRHTTADDGVTIPVDQRACSGSCSPFPRRLRCLAAVVAAHVLTPVQSYFASIHSKRQMKLPPLLLPLLQLEVCKASQVRPSHVIVIHSIPNADPAAAAAAAAASNPNQTSLRRREL